jgi:hypothetical protein
VIVLCTADSVPEDDLDLNLADLNLEPLEEDSQDTNVNSILGMTGYSQSGSKMQNLTFMIMFPCIDGTDDVCTRHYICNETICQDHIVKEWGKTVETPKNPPKWSSEVAND